MTMIGVPESSRRLGFWSAVACSVFSLTYILGQLAEWLGWLGSAGGPEAVSTPLGIVVLLVPSLLLGSAFLLLMVAVHHAAPPDLRVWSHAAVAFAALYALLTGTVYYVQLTLVGPRMLRGELAGIELLVFKPFDSLFYSMDLLGYTFMSVATLLAAFAFGSAGPERHARRFLLANGLLIPFLALQIYFHWLIWPASLWAITFPAATISLARLFRSTGAPLPRAQAVSELVTA